MWLAQAPANDCIDIERIPSVQEATVSLLAAWQNFYVLIGSSSAALTGLMFVATTLIAGSRSRASDQSIAAFGTPTVVHFCVALFVAAILSAPWPALWNAAVLLGLAGLGGVFYVLIVIRRARSQNVYVPVLEDWLGHTIFPFISYAALAVAAVTLPSHPLPALFVIGGTTVLLVFTGIHNAWDTVTYIAVILPQQEEKKQD
jgi:hypothetical protein